MVVAAYGLPVAIPQLAEMQWHWFGSVSFIYGEPLSLLPGVVVAALLAPLVAYRRRDALTLLFPLSGIRVAWIIGTRLGQLPHRDWPARTDRMSLPGRQSARIAAAVGSYRLWRQRRMGKATKPSTILQRNRTHT
jgi:hypothetical protein